ncbi:helix-turn-helix domain-containing protein [Actinoplanes sp. NBRC 103695]|uniref:helix-turn-helix domain-containing protein n=1 Tax=Actinoplanes sp. NBRC 103695 TaxID=3032202 RepID=UPI0025572085|nr:helix-turn-helix domain-containing protein [Actinoplanes sp. NBRC 103695]
MLDLVAADPAADHTLTSMALRAGVSTRHLTRLCREQLGMTATRFVERSRIEVAQRLLTGGVPVTATAQASGFGSDETMRRAFLRHLSITPTAYRERFSTTHRLFSQGRPAWGD